MGKRLDRTRKRPEYVLAELGKIKEQIDNDFHAVCGDINNSVGLVMYQYASLYALK